MILPVAHTITSSLSVSLCLCVCVCVCVCVLPLHRPTQVVIASLSVIFMLMCLTFALVFKSGAVHLND